MEKGFLAPELYPGETGFGAETGEAFEKPPVGGDQDLKLESTMHELDGLYKKVANLEWNIISGQEDRNILEKWAEQVVAEARTGGYKHILFLDRNARPLVYLFKTMWDVENLRTGEFLPEPEYDFFKPGDVTKHDKKSDKSAIETMAEAVGVAFDWNIKKGEKVMAVDEYTYRGTNGEIAEKVLKEIYPDIEVLRTSPFISREPRTESTEKVRYATSRANRSMCPWEELGSSIFDIGPALVEKSDRPIETPFATKISRFRELPEEAQKEVLGVVAELAEIDSRFTHHMNILAKDLVERFSPPRYSDEDKERAATKLAKDTKQITFFSFKHKDDVPEGEIIGYEGGTQLKILGAHLFYNLIAKDDLREKGYDLEGIPQLREALEKGETPWAHIPKEEIYQYCDVSGQIVSMAQLVIDDLPGLSEADDMFMAFLSDHPSYKELRNCKVDFAMNFGKYWKNALIYLKELEVKHLIPLAKQVRLEMHKIALTGYPEVREGYIKKA